MKITKTFNLEDESIKNILDEINSFYGVRVTPSVLKRVLVKNKELLDDIKEYDDFRYGMDTITREDLVNALAIDLLGKDWPTGETSNKKSALFFKEFKKKAIMKNGYKFSYE